MDRRVCFRDSASGDAIAAVRVQFRTVWSTTRDSCTMLRARDTDSLAVMRLGFRARTLLLPPAAAVDTTYILLEPLARVLTTVHTIAADGARRPEHAGDLGTLTVTAVAARSAGARHMRDLVALLPFTAPRSARGELALSLRGSRTQQVLITLDGIPLNDASTGVADMADIPISAISSASVTPGASAIAHGPGASGGVLSLQSARASSLTVRTGSFGERALEGSVRRDIARISVQLGAAISAVDNDFEFVNEAGTTGVRTIEVRNNNDLLRRSAFLQLGAPGVSTLLLLTDSNMGMVGPVNVRAYDADRSLTSKLLWRTALDARGWLLVGSARRFALGYRDSTRPVFNSDARSVSADIDLRRQIAGMLLTAGVGTDRLTTSTGILQDRQRAFASMARADERGAVTARSGARVDAIEGASILPSLSVAVEHRAGRWQSAVRAARAVRVPTLYDVHFNAPQRITTRALKPERVQYDAEARSSATWGRLDGARIQLATALVLRRTADAIIWFPGNFGWTPDNVGLEQLYGVESRATVAWHAATLSTWGAFYDSELRSGGLRIPTPYVARLTGGGTLGFPTRIAHVSAAARHLGRRPFTAGPRNPSFELPSVTLLDLSLSRQHRVPAGNATVSLTAHNLTNRAWQSVRGFPSAGRQFSLAITLTPPSIP